MDRRYRRLQRVEKRLWTAGIGDYREWKNAMDSRFRRSQRKKGYGQQAEEITELKKGYGQQGDEITEWKTGYGQQLEEMTEEKRLWTAGLGDDRGKKAMDSSQRR